MTYTLTIPATALINAVQTAALFAGTDDTLPVLTMIRFGKLEDGTLELAATDRYTLGMARVRGVQLEGDFTGFHAPAKKLVEMSKRITAWLKSLPTYARGEMTVTITVDLDSVPKLVTITWLDGSQTFDVFHNGEFPRYAALVPEVDTLTDDSVPAKGFNPAYLAKFAKVKTCDSNEPLRLHIGRDNRPARVDLGEDFTGLIMPVRLAA